jgi:hypothetical protein
MSICAIAGPCIRTQTETSKLLLVRDNDRISQVTPLPGRERPAFSNARSRAFRPTLFKVEKYEDSLQAATRPLASSPSGTMWNSAGRFIVARFMSRRSVAGNGSRRWSRKPLLHKIASPTCQ